MFVSVHKMHLNIILEVKSLSATGFVNVHAFTSNAQLPLKDVAIALTDQDGDSIALRLTNSSGKLDEAIALTVPDLSDSQQPNSANTPYKTINIYGRKENFEEIYIRNVQIFANTVTLQNMEFIPLSEFPADHFKSESFDIPAQNL